MRSGNLLFSAVQFFFAVLVILLGGLFIGLPYAPGIRFKIAEFFTHQTAPFSSIGYFTGGCGLLLLFGFCAMHRGTYYRLKMGQKETWIDLTLVQEYAQHYWKKTFPDQDVPIKISLAKGQKIEMFVEFPPMSADQQLASLEQAEIALAEILNKQLGYQKEFVLSVLVK